MILLRTCDENGKVQFVTVKNDMFYLECKHCSWLVWRLSGWKIWTGRPLFKDAGSSKRSW